MKRERWHAEYWFENGTIWWRSRRTYRTADKAIAAATRKIHRIKSGNKRRPVARKTGGVLPLTQPEADKAASRKTLKPTVIK